MRPSSALLVGIVKLLVGAYARWIGTTPSAAQRIYFANHTSHIDTLAIWSSLPRELARRTRPDRGARLLGQGIPEVHRDARLRRRADRSLARKRRRGSARAAARLAARGRLAHHLSRRHAWRSRAAGALSQRPVSGSPANSPAVELIPVYLDNLHRSLPKGALLPVPVVCTVRFGAPLALAAGREQGSVPRRARAPRSSRSLNGGLHA